MSKFIVIRKDLGLDPVVIESEGLTLGRLSGNDLALDHPDVSGVHAAIEGADGDYWVFNLSDESGTLLNDEQIGQGPLSEGDVIQIGPYFLSVNYAGADLRLEVELSASPRSVEASGEPPIEVSNSVREEGASQGITIRFDPTWLTGRLERLQRDERAPKDAKRLRDARSLSDRLTGKHALKIFWDKRKREEGKLGADSTIKLKERRFGKAQFNWHPTRDLQAGRPIPLFVWGTLIVAAISIIATFAFQEIYSPGALSTAHARDELSISPAIAKNINSASCSTCHSSRASMNQNCVSCHTTNAFHSEVSEKHLKAALACVDACPHDVLAIVDGKAALVAVEQCMEDTSCQVECPTVPKSCIVVNTTKKILERPAPKRDGRFMTNVPGIYLIGDASGVPLIKNAINEGGAVIDYIIANLRQETVQESGRGGNADYDVAIIGVGPAGLSATAMAHQRGLKYVAIEQDQIVGTIHQTYQAGKYVYFNPIDQQVKGGINLDGAGTVKEQMIGSWMETVSSNSLVINEYESCKDVRPDGDAFIIETEREKTRRRVMYRARRVILAIGNRGAPMKLNVAGEDLKITVTPRATVLPYFCNECGAKRDGDNAFCQQCGAKYIPRLARPYEDKRVKYKLTDPNRYSRRHILVVGAGNSAIETAIDLAAYRSEDGKAIVSWRDNAVSLVVRGNFRSDLKLGNKMLIHECIDKGRVKAYFGQTIKEIIPGGVALMSARERDPKTARATARIRNDYVFALIGGEKPTKFLESIGIKIG